MPWQSLDENKFLPLALLLIDSAGSKDPAVRECSTFPSILHFLAGTSSCICIENFGCIFTIYRYDALCKTIN